MRRFALAVAALVSPALMAVAPAVPAQSAGTCTISVPSTVAINAPYQEYKVNFSGTCTWRAGSSGAWKAVHPTQGLQDFYLYDRSSTYPRTQYAGVYDFEALGKRAVRPAGAYDGNFNSLTQNTTAMTVKLGSRNKLTTSRSGSYVTLRSKVTRYSVNAEAHRAWSGATVKFYSKNADGSWTLRKTASSNTYGNTSTRLWAPKATTWKAVTSATSTTWGRTSATSLR